VLPLLDGTTLLASADNQISVLDIVAAKPLQLLKNHQKTVTSLSLASNGTRVVSGGLDGHVKIFETASWNVVAGFKYPSPILSLSVIGSGASREDKHLAVGMQSGLLSLRTRLSGQQKALEREKQKEMQALIEGNIDEYDKKKGKRKTGGWEKRTRGKDFTGEGADIVIDGNARGKIKNQSKWETALRKGQYATAIDLVLGAEHVSNQNVLTLLTALRHRSALRTALKDRDATTLPPVLKWLNKNIADPRHLKLTSDVMLLLLDLYSDQMGLDPEVDKWIERLHHRVRINAEFSQQALSTSGMLDTLIAGA
ncbi:U3 small nucleolar RNA-associated protein 15, partial [Cryomyces antarcticus]